MHFLCNKCVSFFFKHTSHIPSREKQVQNSVNQEVGKRSEEEKENGEGREEEEKQVQMSVNQKVGKRPEEEKENGEGREKEEAGGE